MFFSKAKSAAKAAAKRIFKRADNSSRSTENNGSVTTTAIKIIAKRVFRRSHVNGSNLDSAYAYANGNSTSNICNIVRYNSTGASNKNSISLDGACIDGASNCSSASDTAVSASISTNRNSGFTAIIDICNCVSNDRASKAVAALFDACAEKIAPKLPSAPAWAFERALAHQPRRNFKGSSRPTKSLGELIRASKMGPLQGSRKGRLLANDAALKLVVEPKLSIAPRRGIEQAPAHQPCRLYKAFPRPTKSLRELIEARKMGLLQAENKDRLSANNAAYELIVEPIAETQMPFPCYSMPVTPYY